MKIIRTTIAILMASALGFSAQAQKTSGSKVPAAVKKAFAAAYPSVKTVLNGKRKKAITKPALNQGEKEMSAVFMADGMQLESEMEIKASDLPASVIAYIKEHYKGASIKEAAKITKTSSGEVTYEAEVKGQDLIFSADGKFIKAVKD